MSSVDSRESLRSNQKPKSSRPEMSPTRYSSNPIKNTSIVPTPHDARKSFPESDTHARPCSSLTDNNSVALSSQSLSSFSSPPSSSSSPSSIATSPSLSCSWLSPSSPGSFAQSICAQDHDVRDDDRFSSCGSSYSSTTKPFLSCQLDQSQLQAPASLAENHPHPHPHSHRIDAPLQEDLFPQHIGHPPGQLGPTKRGPLHQWLNPLQSQQENKEILIVGRHDEKSNEEQVKDEEEVEKQQQQQQAPPQRQKEQGQQRQQGATTTRNITLSDCSPCPRSSLQLTLNTTKKRTNLGPSPLSPLSPSPAPLPVPSCPLEKAHSALVTSLPPSSSLLPHSFTFPSFPTLSSISASSLPPLIPPNSSSSYTHKTTRDNRAPPLPPSLAITSPGSAATPTSPHPPLPFFTNLHNANNARPRHQSVPDLPSHASPRQRLSRSNSASSILLRLSPCSPGTHSSLPLTAESTTSTTLSFAYPQPFLLVPSFSDTSIKSPNSIQQLRELDSFANPSIDSMTRQRSQSTSSMGAMARSPTSIVTSLSTSVALYNSLQPPKSLQDILLLAQSHYISHRYVPALTLYKLAVEQHHSLPACCSLYALYTSTRNEPGLTRSDTKAAHILIHALRIWTARRWSSSRLFDDDAGSAMRSRTRDEHDELEEYFAPKSVSKKRSAHSKMNRSAGHKNIPIRSSGSLAPPPGARSESVQSEYRNSGILGSISNEEVDEEPDIRDQRDNLYHSEDEEEGYESYEEACEDDCEGEDEEQAKEEEARRIGLATAEIEDIVQKMCALIQKGVLALDEPIVVEAVTMLRKIERGLSTEADVWKQQQERSQSLFSSSLSGSFGGSRRNDELSSTNPGLLLTQGVDLSFLNFSPDEEFSIAQAPVSRPSRVTSPPQTMLLPPTKQSPVNRSISNMSTLEQETDQAMCRAIRIRVMFTLGWVHQRLGEYHYGAQAYGVCSEITPKTGKRVLDSLQQEATVQKFTCRAFEKKALEQAQKKEAERKQQLQQQQQNRKDVQNRSSRNSSIRSPTPASTRTATSPISAKSSPSRSNIAAASSIKDQLASRASSVYNSSESASTITNRPDISRPSSPSNSETSVMPSTQGAPISSLSAWSSGLFKLSNKPTTTPALSTSSPDKDNTSPPRLLRSKSVSHGLKINTLDALTIAVEAKDRNSNKPLVQQRHSKPVHQASAPSLTMVGHQTQVAKCGHCGQKRVLMPLCVCKKVRYCNRECRLADMEVHRKTGCHAAMIGSVAGLGVSSVHGRPSVASVTSGIAI